MTAPEQTALLAGYLPVRTLPTGEVAGVLRMLFTYGLFIGIHGVGDYRTRYCYEHRADAELALAAWDGAGDPPGPWIKQKPEDRLGPGCI